MRRRPRGIGSILLLAVISFFVLLAAFGLFFLNWNAQQSSMSLEVSSLRSASTQASSLIVAQQSTISCLQSEVRSLQNTSASSSLSTSSGAGTSSGSSSTKSVCVQTSAAHRVVNITASLTVPSGSGKGNLVVTVWNGASIPISGIYVNVTSSGLLAESGNPVFDYNGQPVSLTNPLPSGITVTGNSTLTNGSSGLYVTYGYQFVVTVTFLDGVVQTQSFHVAAQV